MIAPSGASLTETYANLVPLYRVRRGEAGDAEVGGDQPLAGQGGMHAGGGQEDRAPLGHRALAPEAEAAGGGAEPGLGERPGQGAVEHGPAVGLLDRQ